MSGLEDHGSKHTTKDQTNSRYLVKQLIQNSGGDSGRKKNILKNVKNSNLSNKSLASKNKYDRKSQFFTKDKIKQRKKNEKQKYTDKRKIHSNEKDHGRQHLHKMSEKRQVLQRILKKFLAQTPKVDTRSTKHESSKGISSANSHMNNIKTVDRYKGISLKKNIKKLKKINVYAFSHKKPKHTNLGKKNFKSSNKDANDRSLKKSKVVIMKLRKQFLKPIEVNRTASNFKGNKGSLSSVTGHTNFLKKLDKWYVDNSKNSPVTKKKKSKIIHTVEIKLNKRKKKNNSVLNGQRAKSLLVGRKKKAVTDAKNDIKKKKQISKSSARNGIKRSRTKQKSTEKIISKVLKHLKKTLKTKTPSPKNNGRRSKGHNGRSLDRNRKISTQNSSKTHGQIGIRKEKTKPKKMSLSIVKKRKPKSKVVKRRKTLITQNRISQGNGKKVKTLHERKLKMKNRMLKNNGGEMENYSRVLKTHKRKKLKSNGQKSKASDVQMLKISSRKIKASKGQKLKSHDRTTTAKNRQKLKNKGRKSEASNGQKLKKHGQTSKISIEKKLKHQDRKSNTSHGQKLKSQGLKSKANTGMKLNSNVRKSKAINGQKLKNEGRKSKANRGQKFKSHNSMSKANNGQKTKRHSRKCKASNDQRIKNHGRKSKIKSKQIFKNHSRKYKTNKRQMLKMLKSHAMKSNGHHRQKDFQTIKATGSYMVGQIGKHQANKKYMRSKQMANMSKEMYSFKKGQFNRKGKLHIKHQQNQNKLKQKCTTASCKKDIDKHKKDWIKIRKRMKNILSYWNSIFPKQSELDSEINNIKDMESNMRKHTFSLGSKNRNGVIAEIMTIKEATPLHKIVLTLKPVSTIRPFQRIVQIVGKNTKFANEKRHVTISDKPRSTRRTVDITKFKNVNITGNTGNIRQPGYLSKFRNMSAKALNVVHNTTTIKHVENTTQKQRPLILIGKSSHNKTKSNLTRAHSFDDSSSGVSDKTLVVGVLVGVGFSLFIFILSCMLYKALIHYRARASKPINADMDSLKSLSNGRTPLMQIELAKKKLNKNGSNQYVVSILGKKDIELDSSSEEEEVFNRSIVDNNNNSLGNSPSFRRTSTPISTPNKTKTVRKPLLQ